MGFEYRRGRNDACRGSAQLTGRRAGPLGVLFRAVPQLRDIAVCVRHWDFSETSQTVSLLTREHGILRGLAKGSRRDKGDFSGGIDLLTCGEVIAIVKPSGAMATLTQCISRKRLMRALRF